MPVSADLIVIGGGAVGLASALAAAGRGLLVHLITAHRPGEASPAAAGMLAPTVELADLVTAAHAFALASRDRYPSYLESLRDLSGIAVPLNRLGILELADDPAGTVGSPTRTVGAPARTVGAPTHSADASARSADASPPTHAGEWLDRAALAALEPALSHAPGARYYPEDGAVDNVLLLAALEAALSHSTHLHRSTGGPARSLEFRAHDVVVHLDTGSLAAKQVVLAAGAWAPLIAGLPRPLPVEPVRGQMLSLQASPLRHVVYGPNGYLVPRAGTHTLVGSTTEHVAFDASTTDIALQTLRATADTICPALTSAPTDRSWAGLRPMTPDLLPIIGRDPDHPSLIYACGHSRNGVLMAPLTADCVAALALNEAPPAELRPFAIERFANFHK